MANPSGHVVLDEEASLAAKECYAALGAELQALQARNEGLTCGLQAQEELVAAEWLRGDRRAQAQMRGFAKPHGGVVSGAKRTRGTDGWNAHWSKG